MSFYYIGGAYFFTETNCRDLQADTAETHDAAT